MDSRHSFSCVAGYIDRPEIILRSLKLKNNVDNENDDQNENTENNDVIDFNTDNDNDNNNIDTNNSSNNLNNLKNSNDNNVSSKYEIVTYKCTGKKDFLNLNDPFASCVLLKAVVVVLGVVDLSRERGSERGGEKGTGRRRGKGVGTEEENINKNANNCDETFVDRLGRLSGIKGQGLEIICCSELPAGSGK